MLKPVVFAGTHTMVRLSDAVIEAQVVGADCLVSVVGAISQNRSQPWSAQLGHRAIISENNTIPVI